MPEVVAAQQTPEWREARKGKITASLAAACLRIDGADSAASAWREIMDRQTPAEKRHAEEDFNLRYGLNFEPIARASYEADTGRIVTETGLWVHPTLPWLAASPDGLIGRDGLLECKCLKTQVPMVPIKHRIQCLIQLACTGRLWVDYYVWPKPPLHPQLWRINRCRGIAGLIVRLDQFRRDYIETATCPGRKK